MRSLSRCRDRQWHCVGLVSQKLPCNQTTCGVVCWACFCFALFLLCMPLPPSLPPSFIEPRSRFSLHSLSFFASFRLHENDSRDAAARVSYSHVTFLHSIIFTTCDSAHIEDEKNCPENARTVQAGFSPCADWQILYGYTMTVSLHLFLANSLLS